MRVRPLPRPAAAARCPTSRATSRPHSEYSKTLNEARLKVLAAREAAIQGVVKEARGRVRDTAANAGAYKKLMQDLLVQVGGRRRRGAARSARRQ